MRYGYINEEEFNRASSFVFCNCSELHMKKMAVKNFNNFNNGQRSVSYSLFSIKKSLNELLGYMVVVEQSPELSKKQ